MNSLKVFYRLAFSLASTLMFTATMPVAHAGWQQTFEENFDGTDLDMNKWKKTDFWGLHTYLSDGDQQCYADANVVVDAGKANLIAKNEVPQACNPDPGTLLYTSGMISTSQFTQAYGYFEFRAKLPAGKGLDALVRLAIPGGSFPPRPPEIIPIELLGNDPTNAILRYSYVNDIGNVENVISNVTGAWSSDYHVYGVDWQPGLIIYYVDGVEKYRYANPNVYSNPLYVVANLAVGNIRAGSPDASTVFPATMSLDYVKVWQRVNDGQPDTLPPTVQTTPPEPVDKKAPTVSITSPKNLQRITFDGKKLNVTASSSDDKGVASIEYALDGAVKCSIAKPSASSSCQITLPTLGKKELLKISIITVTAKDSAGNSTTKKVSILIVNL